MHTPANSERRSEFGATWWGQAWLRALIGIDDANRLPRGRNYARKGMVIKLDINEHIIEARVRGSRPTPYKVSIGIQRFSTYQKDELVRVIRSQSHLLASLFTGQVPPDLEPLSRDLGLNLFPDSWRDLSMQCSCPDWAVPCKHLAAVLYLVAREIDLDPFLIFRLHGVDLKEELHLSGFLDDRLALTDIPVVTDILCNPSVESDFPVVSPEEPDYQALPRPLSRFFECLDAMPGFYPSGDFRQILIRFVRNAIKVSHQPPASSGTRISLDDLMSTEFVELSVGPHLQVEATWLYLTEDRELMIPDFRVLLDSLILLPDQYVTRMSDDIRLLIHTARLARQMIAAGMFWPQMWATGPDTWSLLWWPVDWVKEWQYILDAGTPMVREGLISVGQADLVMAVLYNHRFRLLLAMCISRLLLTAQPPGKNSGILAIHQLFFNDQRLQKDGLTESSLAEAIHNWLGRIRPSSSPFRPAIVIDALPDGKFCGTVQVSTTTGQDEPLITLRKWMEEERFAPYRLALLKNLDFLSASSPWLALAIRNQTPVTIPEKDLWPLFNDILPVLKWLDIPVFLPENLKGLVKPSTGFYADIIAKSNPAPGLLNLDELLDFRWQIALGDHQVDINEFLRLYERGKSVIQIKDDYVIVDPAVMSSLLDSLHKAKPPTGLALWRHILAEDFNGGPVSLGNNLQDEIRKRLSIPEIPIPNGLHANLRPYQERGFRWLYRNIRLTNGAIIADDMGLGKTIQVITLMLVMKNEHPEHLPRILVVAPASLLGNWYKEIERFAPCLGVNIHHGASRKNSMATDVTLTTYGIVRMSKGEIHNQDWDLVVIDEAQAIKNSNVGQTRSVKALKAKARIAMTGTPVENRLSDYWSIFDFTLPGYLGSQSWFEEQFGIPIQQLHDRERLDRFRKMADPFVLRRMKTDKSIIPDLPEKIDVNQYCDLTPEQASLYQARTDSLNAILAMEDKFRRSGLLFKLLVQLKQVCNHPAHFQKETNINPNRSGKTNRILEIVDDIVDSGEQCLIFTQFKEMASLLARLFEHEKGIHPLIIHGGMTRKARDQTIFRFQSERNHPIMIVTIKAGGSGLNLTAATQVIHFDLWWNPAVESQATDRAYRIGQNKRVLVHRLICRNTLEEKIDRLIQSKKQLASLAVSQGEKWIGDLSSDEIRDIIRLDD